MVLTLYAAMRAIDPSLLRASAGLGASGFYTFRRVYFPLSLLVVTLALYAIYYRVTDVRRLIGAR